LCVPKNCKRPVQPHWRQFAMSIADLWNSWLNWKLFTIRSFMARKLLRYAVLLATRIAPWRLDGEKD
jgi:hypothetical protein